MSYFDDASLVFIPSGYKTSKAYSIKPTDGSGDLTFSRSNDTATRVNSAGLIEKVRTNICLQSEGFNTASWTAANTTITANAGVAPNGTTTADKIVPTTTGTSRWVEQSRSITSSIPYTNSFYVKADGFSWVNVFHIDGNLGAYFNVSNGTIGTVSSGVSASIVSVGSGWYRCIVTKTSGGSTGYIVVQLVDADGSTTATASGTNGVLVWGAQIETGDIATDYIATTSAAVSVGPVANVPRLDYLNSSCPRLLLEPQRTNRAQYSEQFSNAFWTKDNFTISSNVAVSPDGSTNADKIVSTSANGEHLVYYFDSLNGGSGTISVFVKKAEYRYAILRSFSGSYKITVFDFNTLTFPVETLGTGKSESYGNGWYRISVSYTLPASGSYGVQFGFSPITDHVYTGDGTSGGFAYGFQFEAGAYATSYIPTLGAAVTRGDELATKTSASALIGQTEGTLFLEFDFVVGEQANYGIIYNAGFSTYIYMNQQVSGSIFGQVQPFGISFSVAKTSGRYKCALAYKSGSSAFFVNGVQVGTTNTTTFSPSAMDIFSFLNGDNTKGIRQALLFKTRLSNADLAALTA